MAKRESMAETLARLQMDGEWASVAPWQSELRELVEAVEARPATRVVRVEFHGTRRVYEGWRSSSIAETLSACAQLDGDYWIAKVTHIDARGRSYEGHVHKDGAHRLWRQNNPDAARANNRKQAARSRERMRMEWHEYCAAYVAKFPKSMPIGFDRWCRGARKLWLDQGIDGVQFNDTSRSMAHQVAKDVHEVVHTRQRH